MKWAWWEVVVEGMCFGFASGGRRTRAVFVAGVQTCSGPIGGGLEVGWRWTGGGLEVVWRWTGGGLEVGRAEHSHSPDRRGVTRLGKAASLAASLPGLHALLAQESQTSESYYGIEEPGRCGGGERRGGHFPPRQPACYMLSLHRSGIAPLSTSTLLQPCNGATFSSSSSPVLVPDPRVPSAARRR